ncbi:TetR/AcrR family transcriptional regulator [Marmoricola sp. RAF53]|uniref:TetR/AcrR family transcriptional regulator n=1 Tax=Marmoricola sp. RAF53 TaxID=3233059 RepID=UPI003F991910
MTPRTGPTPTRTRLSAEERREQIVDAARRVFIAHGLGGSRTRDIAAEAGINEALLYRHFDSKEALFETAIVDPLRAAVAHLAEAAGDPPADAESSLEEMHERTRMFIGDLVTVMSDIAPLLGVMIFSGEAPGAQSFQSTVAPVLDQVADVIRKNLGWWDHRAFDPDNVVRLLFGAVWFEVTANRLGERSLDTVTFVDELTDTLIFGLAARP